MNASTESQLQRAAQALLAEAASTGAEKVVIKYQPKIAHPVLSERTGSTTVLREASKDPEHARELCAVLYLVVCDQFDPPHFNPSIPGRGLVKAKASLPPGVKSIKVETEPEFFNLGTKKVLSSCTMTLRLQRE